MISSDKRSTYDKKNNYVWHNAVADLNNGSIQLNVAPYLRSRDERK